MNETNKILLETMPEAIDSIDNNNNSFMKGALVGGAAIIAGTLTYKYAIRPVIGKIRSKFVKEDELYTHEECVELLSELREKLHNKKHNKKEVSEEE